MTPYRLFVSCEHASNRIPAAYRELFTDNVVLESHRGWDIGALQIAKQLAVFFDAPLHAANTSRLLVDLNRSQHHQKLFSEFVRDLSREKRETIIQKYYLPYRLQLTENIASLIRQKHRVLHISVHSFTPVMNGEVRNADIGLLYDPKRQSEKALCHAWQQHLKKDLPATPVRRNYPYTGIQDGLITSLRKQFGNDQYSGIELEINQRIAIKGGQQWQQFRERLLHSLKATLSPTYKG